MGYDLRVNGGEIIETAKVCGGKVERWDSHFFLVMPTVHLNGSYMNKYKFKDKDKERVAWFRPIILVMVFSSHDSKLPRK